MAEITSSNLMICKFILHLQNYNISKAKKEIKKIMLDIKKDDKAHQI